MPNTEFLSCTSKPLYSQEHAFSSQYQYRDNAWIQDQYNSAFINETILPVFDELLKTLQNDVIHVSDLCCGDGYVSFQIFKILAVKAKEANKKIKLIGIDVSEQQIAAAKQYTVMQNDFEESTIEFVQSPIEEYQCNSDNRVHLLLCLFGLHLIEDNLSEKLHDVLNHLAQPEAKFLAIYPLRVSMLSYARSELFQEECWNMFKPKIRFIADSNDTYEKAVRSVFNTDYDMNVKVIPQKVTQEKFRKFLQSWMPEFRGVIPRERHDEYFSVLWDKLKLVGVSHPETGCVHDDGVTITFNDRIVELNSNVRLENLSQENFSP